MTSGGLRMRIDVPGYLFGVLTVPLDVGIRTTKLRSDQQPESATQHSSRIWYVAEIDVPDASGTRWYSSRFRDPRQALSSNAKEVVVTRGIGRLLIRPLVSFTMSRLSIAGKLQHFRGVVGQPRTLAATQGHVRAVRPRLEAVDGVSEARRGLGEVGRVDLFDIAQADDLGAGTGAGDQGLHLLGRQVLRLVEDEVARQEGTPTHEVHRPDLDPRRQQVVGRRAAPGTAVLVVGQHFQVV